MSKRIVTIILCLILCMTVTQWTFADDSTVDETDSEELKDSFAKVTGINSEDLLFMKQNGEISSIIIDPSSPRVSFSTLEQLKSLCAKTYSTETVALCTMESGEFVFTQDLTIPKNLIVVFGIKEKSTYSYTTVNVPVRIKDGVTVTLGGQMAVESMTVDGKMIIEMNAYLSGYEFEEFYLTVNGEIENRGYISADEIIGLDYILQMDINSHVTIKKSCSSQDELLNLLDYYKNNWRFNIEYQVTFNVAIDIKEKVTVPSNVELILEEGGTIRSGGCLNVQGTLEISSYSKSVTLNIAGEIKNRNRIYIKGYLGYISRLSLKNGGSYTCDGYLLLYSSSGSVNIADMLPGFDLSQFSTETNFSYTQLTLKYYTEPWDDGEIASFEELKEMAEYGGDADISSYTGPNPLVIEEDLRLGSAQDLHIFPTDIVVPEGVTFTVPSFFSCHNLTVHGTMNVYSSITMGYSTPTDFTRANPNTTIVDGELNLYADEYGDDYYFPASLATSYLIGDENIHLLGEGNMVYIIRPVENDEDIRAILYEAQSDNKEWKEYCPSIYSDYTLTGDLTIPRGCSLDLYDGTLTIPEGVTLTIYGSLELRGGKVDVQGNLVNENKITIYKDVEDQIRLRDDSCYDGDGTITIWTYQLSTRMPGFELSNYYIYYGDSNKIVLTRSEDVYNEIKDGSEASEKVFYNATAQITYKQTEARTMLQYVNEFRTGELAYYNNTDGSVVSLVGKLKPLEYSYSLEEIAMQRAAEIAVQALSDHSRPNGQGFSSLMSSDGKYSSGENFGISSQPSVYDFYISLREDDLPYGKQGHRRNMLGDYKYMGVGYTEYCGWGFLVQEFGGSSTGAGKESPAVDGTVVTVIEVSSGNVYRYDNVKSEPEAIELAPLGNADCPLVSAELFLVDDFFLNTDSPVTTVTPDWEIGNSEIVEIRDGKIIALADGETTLKTKAFGQEVIVPVIVSSTGVKAPVISKHPADLSVELGANANLQIAASGSSLRYQWYYRLKDGADWKEVPDASAKTDSLSFKATANYNNCDFQCVVKNVAGSVASKTVRLTINAKLNKDMLLLPYFRTDTLKLMQADGTGASAYWSSSNTNILAVGADGKLKPKKCGVVTVTATAGDGRVKASCKVIVVFSDVAASSKYYYKPVYWAFDNGITQGYTSGANIGKFGVGMDCQRRELMIFLWRYAGQPTEDKNGNAYGDARNLFNDLEQYGPESATNKAIAWAYQEGITKGYSDGGFHPKDPIVRKDVMILLYRLAGKPAVSGTLTFPDCKQYNKTSDTYRAILWGSNNEITKGYSSGEYAGKFGVNLNCLREQIVTFLYRYNNLQ